MKQTLSDPASDHCPLKTNHLPHSRSPLVVTFDIKMYCYVFNGKRVGTLWKPGQLIVISSRLSEVWQICFPFASPPQKTPEIAKTARKHKAHHYEAVFLNRNIHLFTCTRTQKAYSAYYLIIIGSWSDRISLVSTFHFHACHILNINHTTWLGNLNITTTTKHRILTPNRSKTHKISVWRCK